MPSTAIKLLYTTPAWQNPDPAEPSQSATRAGHQLKHCSPGSSHLGSRCEADRGLLLSPELYMLHQHLHTRAGVWGCAPGIKCGNLDSLGMHAFSCRACCCHQLLSLWPCKLVWSGADQHIAVVLAWQQDQRQGRLPRPPQNPIKVQGTGSVKQNPSWACEPTSDGEVPVRSAVSRQGSLTGSRSTDCSMSCTQTWLNIPRLAQLQSL